MVNQTFPQGLTFDDVLLLPGYVDFSRSDIELSTMLTKNIRLKIPFVASPMDTATEAPMAIALARLGGIGIIHRNLSVEDQAAHVALVHKEKLLVGAAVGASDGYETRVEALVKAGVSVLVVDAAHGFTKKIIDAISFLKNRYPNIDVIGGNIATYDAAKALIAAGADALRVGMGPGAICTTRIISGMGVPQITAISETVRAAKVKKIPVIADGGLKYSGDMVKALAAGASSLMMGSFFASCFESPGKIYALRRHQVPARFQSILKQEQQKLPSKDLEKRIVAVEQTAVGEKASEVFYFKEYRGMGSIGAMKAGAKTKSEDEYHGKSYKDRVLVAEGVEGLVPVKGSVQELIDQAVGGIKSGMYYVGAVNLPTLVKKAEFIQITHASLTESHPHNILITNPGKNY